MPIFPFDRHENQAGGPKRLQKRLKTKQQELFRIKQQIRAGDGRAEVVEYRRQRKRAQQELFQLERELRAAKEGHSGDEPGTGALPDFVIIGARKAGTTFL